MGKVGSLISFAAVSAVSAYLAYVTFVLLRLFYPTWNVPLLGDPPVPEGTSYHRPYYPATQRFDLLVYLCPGTTLDEADPFQEDKQCGEGPFWRLPGIILGAAEEPAMDMNITLPHATRNNGSMVAHAYLVADGKEADPRSARRDRLLLHVSTLLTRYVRLLPQNTTRNLLESDAAPRSKGLPGDSDHGDETNLPIVSHWTPVLHLEVVDDRNEYPFGRVPSDLPMRYVQSAEWPYLPMFQINELGIQRKHLIPIVPGNATLVNAFAKHDNSEVKMPLKITFRRVHLGMFRIGRSMAESLKVMSMPASPMKLSEKEIDNLRQMFFETEPRLLAATLVASILHLLFDFLAFKSDIAHWRNKKTMEGISKTSVTLSALGHLIAVFYLWDKRKETSFLVIGGSIVTAAVDLWKVAKVVMHPPGTVAEKDTAQIDSRARKWTIGASVICVVAYAVWSLGFREHTGYWSFLLDTAMWTTYLLGFINMTPQIFMNYRLKSVEAMPLNAFLFKAINTFVDDLFAFVIPMPTLTRLSVFRDDFIFFVLCFQWWIYPTRSRIAKKKEEERVNEAKLVAVIDKEGAISTAVSAEGRTRARRKGRTEKSRVGR